MQTGTILIEDTETGEVTESKVYTAETPEELAALLGMSDEEFAEALAR